MMSFFQKLIGDEESKEETKKALKKKDAETEISLSSPAAAAPEIKTETGWLEQEGQLTVDVFQTDKEIIVQSAVAGIKPEELDISLNDDVLTIRGERKKSEEEKGRNYYYQECYWGAFSRKIILPVEVDSSQIEATMEKGILTIKLPILKKEKKKKIAISEKK